MSNQKARAFLRDLYKLCKKHNVSLLATYEGECRIDHKEFRYDFLNIDLKKHSAQLGETENNSILITDL